MKLEMGRWGVGLGDFRVKRGVKVIKTHLYEILKD